MIHVINECILFAKNKNILQVDIPINHPSLFLVSLPPSPKDSQSHSVAWMVLKLILGIPYSCWCPTVLEGPVECLQAPGSTTGMTLWHTPAHCVWPTSCAWWLVGVQILLMNYRFIMCRGFYPLLQSRLQICCTIHLVWDLPPNLIPPHHLLTGTCVPFLSLRQQQFSL